MPAIQADTLLSIHRTVDRSSPRPGASFRVIRRIFQSEGGIAPFYRGLAPNIIGNSSSWALYFLFYGNLKDGMRKLRSSREQELAASDFFLASGAAGMKDTDWAHGQRSAPFPFPLIWYLSSARSHNVYPYQPDLGHQDPHAINRCPSSRSVQVVHEWRKANLPIGGHPRILPRTPTGAVRGQPRGASVHGVRATQGPTDTDVTGWRIRSGAETRTRQSGFLPHLQFFEDLCRLRHVPVSGAALETADLRCSSRVSRHPRCHCADLDPRGYRRLL